MKTLSKNYSLVLVAALAAASLSAGCSRMHYLQQARDRIDYTAVPQMRYAQTLNPEAGQNRKVVAGLDSQVAQNIQKGYAQSFIKADPSQKAANAAFLGLKGVSND